MFPTVLVANPIVVKYNELQAQVLDNNTVQEVLYTFATVLGFIAGVALFVKNAIVSWYNNGGKEWMLNVIKRASYVISNSAENVYYYCCDSLQVSDTIVPVVEVAQKKSTSRKV